MDFWHAWNLVHLVTCKHRTKLHIYIYIYIYIYINDTDDSVNSKILKFADDTKVFNTVRSEKDVDSL